jgi:hypothetical protein
MEATRRLEAHVGSGKHAREAEANPVAKKDAATAEYRDPGSGATWSVFFVAGYMFASCPRTLSVLITFLDNKEPDARAPSVPRRAKSQRLERDLMGLPCSIQTWDRNDQDEKSRAYQGFKLTFSSISVCANSLRLSDRLAVTFFKACSQNGVGAAYSWNVCT